MARAVGTSYIAECFWSGVRADDLPEVDRRIGERVAELTRHGEPIRYLGSMLILDDEVVLYLFEGPIAAVRYVLERADVPFERIVHIGRAPWSRYGRETT